MSQEQIQQDIKTFLQTPNMAQVIMLNDDYTPMDFVVEILIQIFDQGYNQANQTMLSVHNNGSGICGTYPYDIAELKLHLAEQKARSNDYPLQFTLKDL
ncbi:MULTISPECIES: ATP-dependent Clp protease adaptor ClpS [unclassified Helicobacter]|uniref:ATP-dependent Clp protease adaptor ClpS n=1 Tax=unclassified Helicobacter TaxID=2593540 RepID=UPI000CF051BA|nr:MULTISPECIES: ATP-dependent Clp protease adaptor ClpS [unclassified Helicobacter]